MSPISTITLLLVSALTASLVVGQTPTGYIKVADNDFILGGGATTLRRDITTLPACADACNQDPLCQSMMFTSLCYLYQIRRCMTPTDRTIISDITDKGSVYEKNSPVAIADGSRITTVCGNYSGVVVDSYETKVPARFGPLLNADVAEFTSNCTQHCASLPLCHSWRVLQIYENNPNVPVSLRCTSYADSIYDVDHGIFTSSFDCKRANSVYATNGAAISRPNCGAPPGTGTVPDPATLAPLVGGGSSPSLSQAPIIIAEADNVTSSSPTTTIPPSSNSIASPSSSKPHNSNETTSWDGNTSHLSNETTPWNSSNSTSQQSSKSATTMTRSSTLRVTTTPVVGGGGGGGGVVGSNSNDTTLLPSAATGSEPLLVLFLALNILMIISAY